jgi:hypothetical protein
MIRTTFNPSEYTFRNRWAAEDTLEELIADGQISPCQNPRVIAYRTPENCIRFRIELDER